MSKGERIVNALKGVVILFGVPIAMALLLALGFGFAAGIGYLLALYAWSVSEHPWVTISATVAVIAAIGAWLGYNSDDPVW